jgi:hypothetical protein
MSTLLEQASLVMIPSGYKEDVVYSAVPTDGSGDLSFTRASNGTRVNSAGLVEVCPWNLAQYSEDFSNAVWTLANVTVTANDITAPNGTLTADKFTISVNGCDVKQTISVLPNTVYTWSFYVYGGTALGQQGRFYDNTNLTNIEYYNYSSSVVLGAWVKIERTFTTPSGCYEIQAWVLAATSTIGTMWAWGCQLNIGSTAKPYFPTTDRLNVPRLTYQNGGGGCPSLLLEKQSTNLCVQSNAFNTSPWVSGSVSGTNPVITANYGISPDGTQNAVRIQLARQNVVNSYSQIYQYPINITSGQPYTWSVYLKSLSGTPTISIIGDFGRPPVTLTSEWVRYTGTATAAAPQTQLELAILGSDYATGNSLSADFLAYGYQIEQSSYPTSYIPTTSASATRVADACSKTGISSLIGQTSGSVFFDFTVDTISAQTSDPVLWYMKDGGIGERYVELYSNGDLVYAEISAAGLIANITKSALTVGRHKCAIAYATNDFVFYVDGVQIGTDTSGTPDGYSTFGLQYYLSGYTGQQKVNQAAIFKTRLSNSELQSLTTL